MTRIEFEKLADGRPVFCQGLKKKSDEYPVGVSDGRFHDVTIRHIVNKELRTGTPSYESI